MDEIGITQVEYFDAGCFNEGSFEHRDARIMDRFTKMLVAVARNLRRKTNAGSIPPERLGVVVASTSGPVESIREFGDILASRGYVALNPSKFPNIMLSTALVRVAIEFNARGPGIPLYMEGNIRQALRYGLVQIRTDRCDGVAVLYADEAKCFGLFMERAPSARARGYASRFRVPEDV